MFEEYVKWAQENGGMTEDQIKEFKTLAAGLNYNLDEFAAILLKYQTPAVEIIASMHSGLKARRNRSDAELELINN